MKQIGYLLIISLFLLSNPFIAWTFYGQGNYVINMDGGKQGLKKFDVKLDVNSRQQDIFISPKINGQIDLEKRESAFSISQANILNPNLDLTIGNIIPSISNNRGNLSYLGIELAAVKPLSEILPRLKQGIKPTLYKGRSPNGNITGGKIELSDIHNLFGDIYCFKKSEQTENLTKGFNLNRSFILFIQPNKGSISNTCSGTTTNSELATSTNSSNTTPAYALCATSDRDAALSSITFLTNTIKEMSNPANLKTLTKDIIEPANIGTISMIAGVGYYSDNSQKVFDLRSRINGGNFNVETRYSYGNSTSDIKIIKDLQIKGRISGNYLTAESEYNSNYNGKSFKLQNILKTQSFTSEYQYIILPTEQGWQLKSKSNLERILLGGMVSEKNIKGTESSVSFLSSNLSYNWYAGYKWKLSNAISLSITNLRGGNISGSVKTSTNYRSKQNNTLLNIGASFPGSPLRISSEIDLGINKSSNSGQISLNRKLTLDYSYLGFKPQITYNIKNTRDMQEIGSDNDEHGVDFRCSKDIITNLSATIQLASSNNRTLFKNAFQKTERIYSRETKRIDLMYKFNKLPLRIGVSAFSYKKDELNWLFSINYRETERKDSINCQPEKLRFNQERRFRFGKPPANITPASVQIVPSKEMLNQLGVIAIEVFEDKNGNGIFDSGENGLDQIKANLKKITGVTKKLNVTTNKTGKAYFIDVSPGEYEIIMDLGELPIDTTCGISFSQIIQVTQGKTTSIKFPLLKAGHLSGRVFVDANRNGKWDEKEKGESDIYIYANDKPTNTSGDYGRYWFRNIPPGTYTVKFDDVYLPEGFEFTTPALFNVNVLPGQETANINFGIAEKEKDIDFDEN